LDGEHLLGTIGFSGKVVGQVYLRMSLASGRTIAAGILGLKPEELESTAEVCDVAGELLNIMTGNFKSNLCDAGLDCKLTPPDVKTTSNFSTPREPGSSVEHMAFHAGDLTLYVDVFANPWND